MGPIWGREDPGGPHVGPMNYRGNYARCFILSKSNFYQTTMQLTSREDCYSTYASLHETRGSVSIKKKVVFHYIRQPHNHLMCIIQNPIHVKTFSRWGWALCVLVLAVFECMYLNSQLIHVTYVPIFFIVASLTLGQSWYFPHNADSSNELPDLHATQTCVREVQLKKTSNRRHFQLYQYLSYKLHRRLKLTIKFFKILFVSFKWYLWHE